MKFSTFTEWILPVSGTLVSPDDRLPCSETLSISLSLSDDIAPAISNNKQNTKLEENQITVRMHCKWGCFEREKLLWFALFNVIWARQVQLSNGTSMVAYGAWWQKLEPWIMTSNAIFSAISSSRRGILNWKYSSRWMNTIEVQEKVLNCQGCKIAFEWKTTKAFYFSINFLFIDLKLISFHSYILHTYIISNKNCKRDVMTKKKNTYRINWFRSSLFLSLSFSLANIFQFNKKRKKGSSGQWYCVGHILLHKYVLIELSEYTYSVRLNRFRIQWVFINLLIILFLMFFKCYYFHSIVVNSHICVCNIVLMNLC